MKDRWLVELKIRGKIQHTVTFLEVKARTEMSAKDVALETFAEQTKYQPKVRKVLDVLCVTLEDVYAADCVNLSDCVKPLGGSK